MLATNSSRLPKGAPASKSFMCSMVAEIDPVPVPLDGDLGVVGPNNEVWPRGREPATPQWWMMTTAQPNAARSASAARINLAMSSGLFSSPTKARFSVSMKMTAGATAAWRMTSMSCRGRRQGRRIWRADGTAPARCR